MYKYLGSSETLMYDFLGSISSIVVYLFNLLQYNRKKNLQSNCTKTLQNFFYKLGPDKKINILSYQFIWLILEIALFSYVQYELTGFVNRSFGDMVGTGANYFGKLFHIPFLLVAFCILFWVDPLKQIDLITPTFPLALVVSKLACFCHGCCGGIEWEKGLYNAETSLVEFPIQLVEAGLALLIFIFLIFWRDKAKPGTMFPTYLIIYSATRFFSEFLSGKPDVFWKLKTYHILCIIGVVLGIIEYVIAIKFGDKVSNAFEENSNAIRAFEQLVYGSKVEYRQFKKKAFKKDAPVTHHNKKKKKK